MAVMDMNLKTLNERLEAASLAGGVASQLERKIELVNERGISISVRESNNFLTSELKPGTIDIIKIIILKELNDKLETTTEEFYNTLMATE